MIIAAPRPGMERFTNWIIFKILLVIMMTVSMLMVNILMVTSVTYQVPPCNGCISSSR